MCSETERDVDDRNKNLICQTDNRLNIKNDNKSV